MGEEADFRNILIAEMAIELPCTHPDCKHGAESTPYKTPALDIEHALKVLELHAQLSHGVHGAGGGGPGRDTKKIHM